MPGGRDPAPSRLRSGSTASRVLRKPIHKYRSPIGLHGLHQVGITFHLVHEVGQDPLLDHSCVTGSDDPVLDSRTVPRADASPQVVGLWKKSLSNVSM